MRIKEVTFTTENCESITIPGKYIGEFHVGEIKKVIQRVAANAILDMDVCDEFFIEIHADANKPHTPFGFLHEDAEPAFDRLLRWYDITVVEFTLVGDDEYFDVPQDLRESRDTEEKSYSYYVMWKNGRSEEDNAAQRTFYSENTGWLYIAVGNDEFLANALSEDSIRDYKDPDYADLNAEMCEIGDFEWTKARDAIIKYRTTSQNEQKGIDDT